MTRIFLYMLIIFGLLKIKLILGRKQTCFSNETDPYVYFSTKTSYFQVDNENPVLDDVFPEGCSVSKFWALIRHGTRNPGDDDILLMRERMPILLAEVLNAHRDNKGKKK